jgi:hypothetical protein
MNAEEVAELERRRNYFRSLSCVEKFIEKCVKDDTENITLEMLTHEYIHWVTCSVNKKGGKLLDGSEVLDLLHKSSLRNSIKVTEEGYNLVIGKKVTY